MTTPLEEWVAGVLKAGSVLSTALLAAGVLAYLALRESPIGWTLIHAGLLIVMATPVVRVVVSLVGFVRQRDWFFAAMTIAVLGVLAASVAAAFG